MRLKFGVCIPMGLIWRMCQFLPQQLSVFWAYVHISALLVVCTMTNVLHTPYCRQSYSNMSNDWSRCLYCCPSYGVCDTCPILRIFNTETQLMTDNNIVSIVQVPDTYFENNNRDEFTLFDDLAKMIFHPLKKHQIMLHKIVHFYAISSISHHCPINNRNNVSGHSFRLYV